MQPHRYKQWFNNTAPGVSSNLISTENLQICQRVCVEAERVIKASESQRGYISKESIKCPHLGQGVKLCQDPGEHGFGVTTLTLLSFY